MTLLLALLVWNWLKEQKDSGRVGPMDEAIWDGLQQLRETMGLMGRWRPNVPHNP